LSVRIGQIGSVGYKTAGGYKATIGGDRRQFVSRR
jgi:hypothetical protein